MKLDTSPPIVHCDANSLSFDRAAFTKTIPILAVELPASETGSVLKATSMRGFILDLPKMQSVEQKSPDQRMLLLRIQDEDQLSQTAKSLLSNISAKIIPHQITLNYEYWTATEILHSLLPENLREGSPTGFAATGHIAHLNLNDEYLPFKHIIGQVILDKNKRIRTVVNKLDNINNQFRFFDMELIAGEPDFITEHHESNCYFTFDFMEVYWNSRLHTEHERLVRLFDPSDGVIADVFAGVGPFAVPAAKKGCVVLANDLNPNSAKWLKKNVEDNSVVDKVRVTCEDGREFIRQAAARAAAEPFPPFTGNPPSKRLAKEQRRRQPKEPAKTSQDVPSQPVRNYISHFVMNLPDSAIEFLDSFRGILSSQTIGSGLSYHCLPMIHCHCFTRFLDESEAEEDIKERVQTALGHPIEEDVSLHLVRSVAPNKNMYCISFRLPSGVAYAS